MAVRTILIYDQCGEAPISFTVLPGDLSHLDKTYINSTRCEEKLQDELMKLLFDDKGRFIVKWSEKFPRRFLIENPDTKIIICGFLP